MICFLLLLIGVSSKAMELKNIPPDQVKILKHEFSNVFTGRPSPSELDTIVRRLYESGDFDTVKFVQTDSGDLILEAVPTKRIDDIVIAGNKIITKVDVQTFMDIRESEKLDRQHLNEGLEKLRSQYMALAYLNARVDAKITEKSSTKAVVNINIQEGQPCRISGLQFATNNDELNKNLKKAFGSYLSRPAQPNLLTELSQEIHTYFSDNRYLIAALSQPDTSYNTEKTQAIVKFSIERPFRYALYFEGNVYFQPGEILRQISVNSQNPTGANPSAELAERIKNLYLSRGFADVQVQFEEKVFPQEFVKQTTFRISEGPRVRIRKINLQGNITKDLTWYTSFLADHSNSFNRYGYFVREDMNKVLESLVNDLQNQGYLQAKIKATHVEFTPQRDFVNVEILLDEGPLTLIETIDFKGNTTFSLNQLRGAIGLFPNAPLSLRKLEDSTKKLQEFYTSKGYIDMRVLTATSDLVSYNSDNTRARISFNIYEGPQVRVGFITLEGNVKTHDDVILEELEFDVGQVLTPEMIDNSVYRLQRLGLFGEVSITTLEQGTPIVDRTVIVKVTERNPGLFTSGIGFSNEFNLTLRGYVGTGYRNLGGNGRALTGRIDIKRITDVDFMDHKITLGYLEPHLFSSRTRGLVNFTRSYSIIQRDYTAKTIIATDSNVLEFLLEREFFKHIKFIWNLWTIASTIDFEIDDKLPSDSSVIGTVGPTLEFDFRDNPFNPTNGFFSRLNAEYADPVLGSSRNIQYIRTNGVISHYIPLGSPRWVWANSTRGGYLKNLDPTGAVPSIKAFTLGGRTTIRGYDTDSLPNRDPLAPILSESYFYLVKSELRFPIYNDVGGVLFYDGGAVSILGEDHTPNYRDTTGVGIRYNTPVGPVSAEYGYKLKRQSRPRESEGRLDFSIGTF